MTPRPTPARSARPPAFRRSGAVARMFVALLVVVALPAQALSASVERVWNAAHFHLDVAATAATQSTNHPSGQDALANLRRGGAAAEHYSAERIRDIAQGLRPADTARTAPDSETARLDAHAETHRAGTAHHHDATERGVVYVPGDNAPPTADAPRTGKHDHDGFSPAVSIAPALLTPGYRRDLLALAASSRASRPGAPGERPPR